MVYVVNCYWFFKSLSSHSLLTEALKKLNIKQTKEKNVLLKKKKFRKNWKIRVSVLLKVSNGAMMPNKFSCIYILVKQLCKNSALCDHIKLKCVPPSPLNSRRILGLKRGEGPGSRESTFVDWISRGLLD